jgi:hypothetical protein
MLELMGSMNQPAGELWGVVSGTAGTQIYCFSESTIPF